MATWQDFNGLNLITDPYKRSVAQSLLINELGPVSNGYKLENAIKGDSGWSFGGQQTDVGAKGNTEGLNLLKDIVIHQYGASYWTAELEASLKVKNNVNSITVAQRTAIDSALSSDYGKSKIDANFVTAIDLLAKYADKIEIELQKINPNLELSLGEKLMLIDFKNQYGLSLDNTMPNSMLLKLQNEVSRSNDLTPESIKELFQTTTYYQDHSNTQKVRVDNTYNAALALDSSGILDMEIYTKVTADQFQLTANYFGKTLEELLSVNPDLDLDGGYALLKEGDKLYLPDSFSSDRATQWLTGEGLPWAYNPSTSLTSPLALDLNGDGAISLVSLSKSKTLFDVTGDGMAELTGWIGANDGILVNDVNNNGTIDNITEMFGNQVKINGFVALADKMDTNHDGVVNAQDTNFTLLQVWQDTNQDGISQSNELKSLSELGITEIRTASTPAAPSGDLTCSIADGSFVMNGVEQYAADINFEYNAKITNYVGEYNLSVESLFLPWLRGYGNVKDAEIAYSLDETLFTCKHFTTQKSLHVRNKIQYKWANDGAEIKVA